MRAFMAVILSACLMLSSVTPSLAAGLPVNPLKGVARVVRVKPVELAGANKTFTALIKPSSKLFRVYTPDVRLPGVSATLPGIKITGASPTVPQIYSATSQAVLGGFSIKGLSGTQIHSQYVYNVLMPTLLDTGLVPSTAQMMETEEVLKGFVTGKSEWHSTAMEVDQRGKALVTFAVITEDAQEAVGLIQNFLDRGYGAYNGLADTQAITACLILGEPGEAFLRDLAAQRQAEGLTVSNGWKGAKELISDLELSDELIGNYQAEALDLEYVKEFKAARARVQEKFNQAAAQQEVTDQLSVNASAAVRTEVAAERAKAAEMPELGESADLSMGTSEIPSGLQNQAVGNTANANAAAETPSNLDEDALAQLIEKGINKARVKLQTREIQNDSTYASLLGEQVRADLEAAGVALNSPDVVNAVNFALLSELPDAPLLRQQTVDAITGRKLSLFKQLGRNFATRLSGKMVNLSEGDLGQIEQAVLKTLVEDNLTIDYQQLRAAIKRDVTLVKSGPDSFVEKDENGNMVEYSYTKEVHDFSRLLDNLVPADLRFEPRAEHLGFRPRIMETGVKEFPYLYTSILLKSREKDVNGFTASRKNIYTVVLSDDASIFKKLKSGWSLVTDTYGNLYKTDGKTKKIIYDRKVSVVHLKGLGDMPVVVIQKTNDRLKALNLIFSVMGFSSTGRFLNGSLESQYGGVLGGHAGAWATGLSTGVYLTNILPIVPKIGLKAQVQKHGGAAVLKTLMPVSLGMFAWATIANITGADPNGWGTLVPVIASILASGVTSAAIQQNANPAAKRMKKGKNADELVAGGQLFKTIGSMGAYAAYAAAAALLGKWQYMYAILGIPTALSLMALWTTDLPLPRAQKAIKNISNKLQEVKEKGKVSDWQFFKDPAIGLLFGGLLIFCGSETQASTATKSIMTGLLHSWEIVKTGVNHAADFISRTLPWMHDVSPAVVSDALSTLITGIFTMGPVFAGRLAAKGLLGKLNGVEKVNQKLMLSSAVITLGLMGGMYALGPAAGAALLPMVIGVNALLGNMFTFSFNIMKEHDKKKYNNAFDTLTGALSTAAVIGCFLIPTLINTFITAPVPADATAEMAAQIKQQLAFDQLIVPIGLILTAVLANYRHFANPFDWSKPMSGKALTKLQTSVVDQMQIFGSKGNLLSDAVNVMTAKENPTVPVAEIEKLATKEVARMKTDLAALFEVSVEEFDEILAAGTSKKITESALRRLCDKLGISFKKFKKGMNDDSVRVLESRLYNEIMRRVQTSLDDRANSLDDNMGDDPQPQPAM